MTIREVGILLGEMVCPQKITEDIFQPDDPTKRKKNFFSTFGHSTTLSRAFGYVVGASSYSVSKSLPYNENGYKNGGLMDTGDGKVNGILQYHNIAKKEICTNLKNAVNQLDNARGDPLSIRRLECMAKIEAPIYPLDIEIGIDGDGVWYFVIIGLIVLLFTVVGLVILCILISICAKLRKKKKEHELLKEEETRLTSELAQENITANEVKENFAKDKSEAKELLHSHKYERREVRGKFREEKSEMKLQALNTVQARRGGQTSHSNTDEERFHDE